MSQYRQKEIQLFIDLSKELMCSCDPPFFSFKTQTKK